MIPVRAFENQCFIFYTDHIGCDELTTYQGSSCIVVQNVDFVAATSIDEEELFSGED